MSGGSLGYICYRIEDELCGRMEDDELNALMEDIAKLTHDLEWYLSADTCRDRYVEAVAKFKAKWFLGNRDERLRGYIDKRMTEMRCELYALIGEKEGEG